MGTSGLNYAHCINGELCMLSNYASDLGLALFSIYYVWLSISRQMLLELMNGGINGFFKS